MEKATPGPVASLIDFGYAVKLPLSERVDRAFGLRESGLSLVLFLDLCYEVRRPYFVMVDDAYVAWSRIWLR
jgi:hypothetical protein